MHCVLQRLAPILKWGKIALNLVWQLNKVVQKILLDNNKNLSKSKAKKLAITWDTNLLRFKMDDEKLNKTLQEILLIWHRFVEEVKKLHNFKVPRFAFQRFDGRSITERQLITLSDAGKYLIACMAYLRLLLNDGSVLTALLCCKSRVRN